MKIIKTAIYNAKLDRPDTVFPTPIRYRVFPQQNGTALITDLNREGEQGSSWLFKTVEQARKVAQLLNGGKIDELEIPEFEGHINHEEGFQKGFFPLASSKKMSQVKSDIRIKYLSTLNYDRSNVNQEGQLRKGIETDVANPNITTGTITGEFNIPQEGTGEYSGEFKASIDVDLYEDSPVSLSELNLSLVYFEKGSDLTKVEDPQTLDNIKKQISNYITQDIKLGDIPQD